MRITVLGKSPAWQDADGACSGYLVECEGHRLVLDIGNGVFGKLRKYVDYVDVDTILISHLHADHFLDLVPYAYALLHAPRQQPVPVDRWPGTDDPARPVLYAPLGAYDTFRRLTGSWGYDALIERAFKLNEYETQDTLDLGPLRLRFCAVPHFVASNAVELATADGGRFTFGADSGPSDDLCAFAADTDLLLLEATLPRPERQGGRGHLTPGEAGDHARRAGAKRLVLTHISDELDADWAVREARSAYDGPVEVAREGAVYEV